MENEVHARRTVIAAALRLAALAGLGAFAGAAIAKHRRLSRDGACPPGACTDCPLARDCRRTPAPSNQQNDRKDG
jgi:hypothetical protein